MSEKTVVEEWAGVRLELEAGGAALLVLDAPQRMNAIDDEMLARSLPQALERLAAAEPGAVVLAGAGRAFCAGVDLRSQGFAFDRPEPAERFLREAHRIPVGLRQLGVPVIGAVQGAAVGAGLGMALACDFRFADVTAFFSAPFAEMGLVPDFGVSYFLPRCVGLPAALEMTLTGRRVGAEEGARIGLVNRLVEDPLGDALGAAREISSMSAGAVRATRANVYASPGLGLEEEVIDRESRTQAEALCGPDFRRIFEAHSRAILDRGK